MNWVSLAHLGSDARIDADFVVLQQVVESALFRQLHHHVELLLVFEGAQELHDVRMKEGFEDTDFSQQDVFVVVLVDDVFGQDLHRVALLRFLRLHLLHLAVCAWVTLRYPCRPFRRLRSPSVSESSRCFRSRLSGSSMES